MTETVFAKKMADLADFVKKIFCFLMSVILYYGDSVKVLMDRRAAQGATRLTGTL